jgi:hypothetical protein
LVQQAVIEGAQADANIVFHVHSIGTDEPSIDVGRWPPNLG